eukprot:4437705-Alexandrium_andersonii.AAC.1
MAEGKGRAGLLVDELLNGVEVATGQDGCGDAAELLIVYIGRDRAANNIGGKLRSRLRGLPATPVECV